MAGVAAVTAVTTQSNSSVHAIHLVPADVLADQILSALNANDVRAIKIGMLGTRASVGAVARSLPWHADVPVVLDPVLAASSGAALLDEGGRYAMRELLLPRVTLITPNIPEAAVLLGESLAEGEPAVVEQAMRMRAMGARAVLLKGGHATGIEC
ncbi:MAG: hydroxymethylpyrimidine/phosphomethylpyrimidine kinase, partial [Gammaproteobacteria bacterium]